MTIANSVIVVPLPILQEPSEYAPHTRGPFRTLTDADHERRHDSSAIERIMSENPTAHTLQGCIEAAALAIDKERIAAMAALEANNCYVAACHFGAMADEEVALRRYCVAMVRLKNS